MQNKLTPRFLLIGLVLVWGIWSLWPTIKLQNLSDDEKDVLRVEGKLEEIETKAIKQGLDLKGGMYIVLVPGAGVQGRGIGEVEVVGTGMV